MRRHGVLQGSVFPSANVNSSATPPSQIILIPDLERANIGTDQQATGPRPTGMKLICQAGIRRQRIKYGQLAAG